MVLKRCSSERGEREKRFYGDGKGERRRTAFWRAAQNSLNASGAKLTRACVPRTVNGTGHQASARVAGCPLDTPTNAQAFCKVLFCKTTRASGGSEQYRRRRLAAHGLGFFTETNVGLAACETLASLLLGKPRPHCCRSRNPAPSKR